MTAERRTESPALAGPPASTAGADAERPWRALAKRPATAVIAVTVLGAALRFWDLGRQSPWVDEATTTYRLAGSYADLLHGLNDQGFGPLWYTILYAFVRLAERLSGDGAWAFRPAVLRTVPAVCGSLVVPGVYWLARQVPALGEHRWALLAAFLAAVNPYSVYYSRDLKMYGLLLTLFAWQIAWFWHFQATGRRGSYAAAVGTLAVATLVHGTAWWLVLVHALTVTVRRRGHLRLLGPTVLMWALAAVGPGLWYAYGTHFLTRFVQDKDSANLGWIQYSFDLNGKLVCGTPALFLAGVAIPTVPPAADLRHFLLLGDTFAVDTAVANLIDAGLVLLAALVVGGMIFGFKRRTPDAINPARPDSGPVLLWLWAWATVPIVLLAMMSLPPESRWSLYPHYMIFQPRYVAVAWPAWVLILAVSLRRLPAPRRLPLRPMAVAVVGAMLLASSLTNPFTDRLPPHAATARAAAPYFRSDAPAAVLVVESNATSTCYSGLLAVQNAFGLRPRFDLRLLRQFDAGPSQRPAPTPVELPDDARYWALFLRQIRYRPAVETVVMSDRLADTPALSDADVRAALGPGWTLASEQAYRLRYEWHPYLSHGYRTRVWRRKS